MALYSGKISGIGNSVTRINEIAPEDLAIIYNYIFGFESGVIDGFGKTYTATTITINKGLCFAYGYIGYNDKEVTFTFNKASSEQYRFIYAEFDLSVFPNTFEIKVKNNQSSPKIKPNTFRQDRLSRIRTGVYQLPLYRIKLDSNGIAKVSYLTSNKLYPEKVYTSDESAFIRNGGSIDSDVTAVTKRLAVKTKAVATTRFCLHAIQNYINNNLEAEKFMTITLKEEDDTGHIQFIPEEVIVSNSFPLATFRVKLDEGWEIEDISYSGNISVSQDKSVFTILLNNDYTLTEDEHVFINFKLSEI